ncbi:MAG: glycerol-3-phosphate acyltransferase [Burkholderiales bacterium 68-12]|nr:MAG: glycerol-3-phosphate acyltransferase [Burkholderiales bacterium 68-12]
MSIVYSVLAVIAAYLLGSLSFAVIVSRTMGLSDPRTYGSKNPGATNVLRSGSKAAAVVTLLLDAVKGWLPVVLVRWLGEPWGLGEFTLALVGLAAFLGHLWPVFFRFEGGKGVATALGVLVGISGWLGLVLGLLWLVVAAVSRYSSLASLAAAVLSPVVYVLASGLLWNAERAVTGAIVVMAALLVWRHKENIARLIQGKESRLGSKGKGAPAEAAAKAPHKKHKRH